MARNKYPEETKKLILEVSARLFIEKGYDKTSLQDIVNNLGGMTKGAIYHHFKSKEEIFLAVVDMLSEANTLMMARIRDDQSLTGKQKIEKMFSVSLTNPNQKDMFTVTPNLLENPRLLVDYLKIVTEIVVPEYVVPVIEQGVQDGSIKTKYPEELANVLMMLTDVWMNPIIFKMTEEQMANRVHLTNELLKPFGIEIDSQIIIESMTIYRNAVKHG